MKIKDKNLYYVGGVVRDEILGIPSFDIDFCYEGNAIEFAKDLNIIKINPNFGTVRVQSEEGEIDIASTRTETYPKPGHLPVVKEIGCSLKEDLKRRDFTINALAKNTLNNEIIDYFNGLNDIKNKKLRVLHDNSFIDDPSRIIRGLKFAVRFGFELEEETKKLQNEYLENINYDMSYHRLKKELKETFNLNRIDAFNRFISDDIYKLLGPNQKPCKISQNIEKIIKDFEIKSPWIIYLGQFDLSNFELTNDEKTIIEEYRLIKKTKPQNDIEIYNLFVDKPLESVILYAISVNEEIALRYLEELFKIRLETTGTDLKELGIKQGKIYQEIFGFLIKAKIENPELSKNQEIDLIKMRFL